MGYSSRLDGRIEITPPLKWSELRGSKFLASNDQFSTLLRVKVHETTVDTDDGALIRRAGVAVCPRSAVAVKAYGLEDELREMAKAWPGHEFTGAIIREGEDRGDIERYRIINSQVVTEKARLTWQDGSPVDID